MKLWNIPSFVYKYSMYFNAHQPKNKNARVKIVLAVGTGKRADYRVATQPGQLLMRGKEHSNMSQPYRDSSPPSLPGTLLP